MDRIYLIVPAEEYREAQASGALWDDASKSWYIGAETASARFAQWLAEAECGALFRIVSEEAFVASAPCRCGACGKDIEVICLFCSNGVDADLGDPLINFTVSNIWALDDGLAKALERWPDFRQVGGGGAEGKVFANHCPHCAAVQEDYLLHSEPGHVFFGIAPDGAGPVKFTPLTGRVKFSGDYGFEV